MVGGASQDGEKRGCLLPFFSFCVKEIFNFDDLAGCCGVLLFFFILFYFFIFSVSFGARGGFRSQKESKKNTKFEIIPRDVFGAGINVC